jgi:hypothetical protein
MTIDILAADVDQERPTRRAPWAAVGAAAVAVVLLVAGVTYGVGQLSGGGSQPEDALPAGAFAFAKVDLDPPAGQKVDGFRFLRKFPALRDRLGTEDVRRLIFDEVAQEAGWSDVDFDSEVAPWMGQRVGVAAYAPRPDTETLFPEPSVVVALQVTDAGEAREGLRRLVDLGVQASDGKAADAPGFVVTGDYALLAVNQEAADEAARKAADGVLASDGPLAADLAAAADGVAVIWMDMQRAVEAVGSSALGMGGFGGFGTLGAAGGRATYVARFDGPDVFEVAGTVTGSGASGWAAHPVRGLADLPASSVVAFGLADGEQLVPKLMDAIRTSFEGVTEGVVAPDFDEMVAEAERELGVELPEDVAALLGDNLLIALDAEQSDSVEVGARLSTDVARAQRLLEVIEARTGEPLVRQQAGDDLVVASTAGQARRLARESGLGERDGFATALPDLDDAHVAGWVDVRGLFQLFGGTVDENVEPIDGVGFTASTDDDSAEFRIRLVAR